VDYVEFQWLEDIPSFKEGIQTTLHSSGQQLKKFFSSKQLDRPIKAHDLSRLPPDLVNNLSINPTYEGPEIKVLEDTPLYLAVHKPPGIHSHPHLYSDKNTVLNFLASRNIWEPISVNTDHYDRGLLYRLDFETSGVLILAKSQKTLNFIRKDFSTQMKRKFYWAVVNGSFDAEGVHNHYFKASGTAGSKQKDFDEETEERTPGSLAVVKVMEENGKSLLLINLKTGLRHQIRAQLSHLGFPIVGDELYGGAKAERLFLHAFRYEWMDVVEDSAADLFDRFFDLNRALQMSHDMLGRF
jgi:23S rRNA pseudouridine1911/1915/1917 synthase